MGLNTASHRQDPVHSSLYRNQGMLRPLTLCFIAILSFLVVFPDSVMYVAVEVMLMLAPQQGAMLH